MPKSAPIASLAYTTVFELLSTSMGVGRCLIAKNTSCSSDTCDVLECFIGPAEAALILLDWDRPESSKKQWEGRARLLGLAPGRGEDAVFGIGVIARFVSRRPQEGGLSFPTVRRSSDYRIPEFSL